MWLFYFNPLTEFIMSVWHGANPDCAHNRVEPTAVSTARTPISFIASGLEVVSAEFNLVVWMSSRGPYISLLCELVGRSTLPLLVISLDVCVTSLTTVLVFLFSPGQECTTFADCRSCIQSTLFCKWCADAVSFLVFGTFSYVYV